MNVAEDYTFANKPVVTWKIDQPLPDPSIYAIRLSTDSNNDEPEFDDYFNAFLQLEQLDQIDALLLGCWGVPYEHSAPIDQLADAAKQLSALRHLYIGDMSHWDCEVSWIMHSDLDPICSAFPYLQTLAIKGEQDLNLGSLEFPELETFIWISVGISPSELMKISQTNWPKLRHLELWLGGDYSSLAPQLDNVSALLKALTNYPNLNYLGLRNYECTNGVARLIGELGLPESITTLDLSNGNLSDQGMRALLKISERLNKLELLDLHHHFLSDEMLEQLPQQLNCPLNLSDQEDAEEDEDEEFQDCSGHYIFLSE